MKNNAPVIAVESPVLKLLDTHSLAEPNAEPDIDLMEIEEAKKHFDDRSDAETYWAGRTLADRKSTRIAA
ncbi:MAG: hypothetical protein IT426_11820 [Pirellulales bacterium]|nr:hypothetical protein [Pirellulales bacterium]